jgi:hypothetical protein
MYMIAVEGRPRDHAEEKLDSTIQTIAREDPIFIIPPIYLKITLSNLHARLSSNPHRNRRPPKT